MSRKVVFLGVTALAILLLARGAQTQDLTGALIGTVRDQQGAAIAGASVVVSSSALIGGPAAHSTNEKGQLRFPALPPGVYSLDVQFAGFAPRREDGIVIGVGATIDRQIVLVPAGVAQTVVVDGAASRIDARDPGFGTRFGPQDLRAIPSRRASMFDAIRNAPGISPTSPSSGTSTTISAFGSGTNENQFLIDGTNTTCPCNGVARSEPGVDFVQEVQVQSVGASAEFGNVQGAVINVITRQGSERLLSDASFYGQPGRLTAQPVRLAYDSGRRSSGYVRSRYRDLTTNLGGPAIRNRLWFFGGYQHLRDYDSQPGTDSDLPRKYEQDKVFAKLTWNLARSWRVNQSVHQEIWENPEQPRFDRPISVTTRNHARVPALTFGHVTHTLSPRTLWDARVGRFVYALESPPYNGDTSVANHVDALTGIQSGGPQAFADLTLIRTTGKATLNHYRAGGWLGDHTLKIGVQIERGEHHTAFIVPTGVRYSDRNGPSSATFSEPSNTGGVFVTSGLFVTDAITIGDRLTMNVGVRFDHSRAISQNLPRVDLNKHKTGTIQPGLGALFSWNIVSPRLGVTLKLDGRGRTIMRASYGRFSQGVLTGEIGAFHPGGSVVTTKAYVPADGSYSRVTSIVDPKNLRLDTALRAPRTDEYGIGVDREIGARVQVAAAYIRKSGANFIGWEDIGGVYSEARLRPLADGRTIGVYDRLNAAADQRFLLTNPRGYSLTYNGLVTAVEKRRSHGWHAFGSYTFSRASGLQAGSGATAAAAQVSTTAPPPAPNGLTFGRDPNDLTNARARLANDRPHMFRVMGSVDVPKTGFTLAGNLQHFTGKPWAAAAQVVTAQSQNQRILLEPRGTRRLPSQTILDVRLARRIGVGHARGELLFDVLNLLNDTAYESIVSDIQVSESVRLNPTFGQPASFIDPRRVMLGIRVNVGKS